ncbi:MAG: tRNA uridine(34) 5-carboxymethylaminomethyl modification radical SAM/GNAT enzyme Elp3 [Candidatus Methanodesulfokora sp.]
MVRHARVLSGVAVVAVMTKPSRCPHGKCSYCPGGENIPQSYVKESPVVVRASKVGYDPYIQVQDRLRQFVDAGYNPSKVELIVMGGTFTAMPQQYQEEFIKNCFDALTDFPSSSSYRSRDIEEAHLRNEKASSRCVALTVETRPDWAKKKQAEFMLRLGVTRVEIGVQSIYDDVLKRVERGHTVKDTIEATKILKDMGYKLCYHIMPGLPGSDPDRDLEMFKEIFEDSSFRPDMLKIYPTLVIKGTKLFEEWRSGKYSPLEDDAAIDLLAKVYEIMPKWVRVQHVQRDIPIERIEAGVKRRNIRQLVEEKLKKKGVRIKEIRYREVGHAIARGVKPDFKNVSLLREDYEASGGTEVFLTIEDERNDVLMGLLRLRVPENRNVGIVRELHVYGIQVPIGSFSEESAQHRGFGRKLMEKMEEIATSDFDVKKILVISGVGARDYFRKLGYYREQKIFYMQKIL